MFGEIAGGFAEGFAQTSSRKQEQKRLRDVMQFEREQFDYQKDRDTVGDTQSDRTYQFQVDQEAAIEKHRQFGDRIAEQAQQIQKREADIKVIEALGTALDSTKPPAWRQFVLKHMAGELGVDPKSEQFKDLSKLITAGLDPDSLKEVSDMLMGQIPDMQPGQATAFATAILRGDAKLTDVWAQAEGPAKQLTEVADPTSSTGRRYMDEADAEGMPAPAPAPAVSIENKAEGAEAVGLAGLDVKQAESIMAEADAARKILPAIRTLDAAMESGRFVPGTAAGARATLGRAAEALGIDPGALGLGENNPATADVMEAASKQIGLALAGQVDRLTNMSLQFIQDSMPNISRTPGGNILINDLLEMTAQRQIKIAQLLEKYRNDYGTMRPEGKPSFFEARDRLIADYADEDDAFAKRIQLENKRGRVIDWNKVPGVVKDAADAAKGALETPSEDNNWNGQIAVDDEGNTLTWDGEAAEWLDDEGKPYDGTGTP